MLLSPEIQSRRISLNSSFENAYPLTATKQGTKRRRISGSVPQKRACQVHRGISPLASLCSIQKEDEGREHSLRVFAGQMLRNMTVVQPIVENNERMYCTYVQHGCKTRGLRVHSAESQLQSAESQLQTAQAQLPKRPSTQYTILTHSYEQVRHILDNEKPLFPASSYHDTVFRDLLEFLRGINYTALSHFQRTALHELKWGLEELIEGLLSGNEPNYNYIVKLV